MHILHTESSCGWGGQELRILTESQGFIHRGHKVSLLCAPQSPIFKTAPHYGLIPIALDIERKSLYNIWKIRQWLAKHIMSYDIINTHSSTDAWLISLALHTFNINHRPALVRTRHVSSPINKKKLTYWLYQKATQHIVVTGEPVRQQLAKNNQFSLASMTSIPTGIDLEKFCPTNKTLAKQQLGLTGKIIGILATLRDWKGHAYLLQAMQQLIITETNINLVIVGDGPQYDNLVRQAKQLGLTNHVRFVGHQSDPALWLNAMDIFVLPSYGDEGVSQAVIQAMATQLPVITTAVGGMTDAVQHNKTGLIIPTRNASAIAQSIRTLLHNSQFALALGKAAYERAQQYFGLEHMLEKMEAVFNQVISQRKSI